MPVSGVSPEYQINCVLNSDALRADPRNHTVPILGTHVFQPNFSVAERDFRVEDRRAFVVMPKLKLMQTGSRPYPLLCIPPDIGACLEFARQVSEVRYPRYVQYSMFMRNPIRVWRSCMSMVYHTE